MGLKEMFIKGDDAPQIKKEEKPVETAPETPVLQESTEAADGKSVEKMLEHLSDVLEKNNQEGFDYLEFHNAVKKLLQNGQAEESAYKSVFSTVETMGVNKAKLKKSADFYLSVLEKENTEFTAASKNQEKINIIDKEKEIADNLKQVDLLNKRREQLTKEVTESKTRINITTFSFKEAYNKIVTSIKEEIQKIDAYISETTGGK